MAGAAKGPEEKAYQDIKSSGDRSGGQAEDLARDGGASLQKSKNKIK